MYNYTISCCTSSDLTIPFFCIDMASTLSLRITIYSMLGLTTSVVDMSLIYHSVYATLLLVVIKDSPTQSLLSIVEVTRATYFYLYTISLVWLNFYVHHTVSHA